MKRAAGIGHVAFIQFAVIAVERSHENERDINHRLTPKLPDDLGHLELIQLKVGRGEPRNQAMHWSHALLSPKLPDNFSHCSSLNRTGLFTSRVWVPNDFKQRRQRSVLPCCQAIYLCTLLLCQALADDELVVVHFEPSLISGIF